MLSLRNCEVGGDGVVTATYLVSQKVGKDAAPIEASVKLVAQVDGAVASLALDGATAESEDAAFDKLAEVLEGVAKALRARGEPKLGVPVYG